MPTGIEMPSGTESGAVAVDGRNARAARTRHAVVSALLALIEEGDLRPTARRVAERAGVSLRSVYVHFEDLEDLFCAAAAQQFEKISRLVEPLPTDGALDERLDAFVEQRARVLEAGAPVRRAAVVQAPFSPTIASVIGMARRSGRTEIERVFATELDGHDQERRDHTLAALGTIASATTWERLRTVEGLDVLTTRDVVREMFRAVLDQARHGRVSPGASAI